MKTHTFSIVIGTMGCNAGCPWCVSKMTATNFPLTVKVKWPRFQVACRIAQQARDGLLTVLLTGKGEPTLYPRLIEEYLTRLQQMGGFPLIDLQTNGILFDPQVSGNHLGDLEKWRDLGLTLVCFSVAHHDPEKSNALMKIGGPDVRHYHYLRAVETARELGFAIRLNFTLLNSGLHTPEDMEDAITVARRYEVEQLTFREVSMPSDPICHKTAAVVEKERPHGACKKLYQYLEYNGANRLPDLAHGAALFDYKGQNVSVNHCLTDTLDSNDIRQLIFFPNGEIAYDWKYKGARIL
jgi:molybdenum cofactor biosynthesis enzyme MoaA